MTPEEFVKIFHAQKQNQLYNYLNKQNSYVSTLISKLAPDEKETDIIREMIDTNDPY